MSKNKDERSAIWVGADRTHRLPPPPGPSGNSIIVVIASGGSECRKNPMGGILRHNDDNYDDKGNGETVCRQVGQRLCVNNKYSLDNRSTTTKEGEWDPPHPWQCCSGGLVEDCPKWHQHLTTVAVGPWTMMARKTTTTGRGWRAGGLSLIDDKDNQMGVVTGIDGNGTGRTTATASTSVF
jgi:hypothetical protein